jgi:hypothetical protein
MEGAQGMRVGAGLMIIRVTHSDAYSRLPACTKRLEHIPCFESGTWDMEV